MRMSLVSPSGVRVVLSLALGAFCAMTSATASAQEFKLAMSSPPTSLDPHFYNLFPNLNVSDHIFETLVTMDADSHVIPRLAESWTLINNLTWEFKLRKGVKFHDGSEMTAEDVAWSMERPSTIIGSPGKFDVYTKAILNKKNHRRQYDSLHDQRTISVDVGRSDIDLYRFQKSYYGIVE